MRTNFVWWTALPLIAGVPASAYAQAVPTAVPSAASAAPAATADQPDQVITFAADQVAYDSDADVVTASGAVRMERDGNYLAADEVVWDRKSDQVRAKGDVVILTPQGDKLIGQNVVLTDSLREGTLDNLLVVLDTGQNSSLRNVALQSFCDNHISQSF